LLVVVIETEWPHPVTVNCEFPSPNGEGPEYGKRLRICHKHFTVSL